MDTAPLAAPHIEQRGHGHGCSCKYLGYAHSLLSNPKLKDRVNQRHGESRLKLRFNLEDLYEIPIG